MTTEKRESFEGQARAALKAAEDELKSVMVVHRESSERIAMLIKGIDGLRSYLGLRIEPSRLLNNIGLTDACRFVLEESDRPLTPKDVRERLGLNGYPIKSHANMLASIHSVLKRLVQSKFASTLRQGQKVYYMKSK